MKIEVDYTEDNCVFIVKQVRIGGVVVPLEDVNVNDQVVEWQVHNQEDVDNELIVKWRIEDCYRFSSLDIYKWSDEKWAQDAKLEREKTHEDYPVIKCGE